jgi:hypothetical protein
MKQFIDNYKKYRWFFTSSKRLVIGGKSALQNEELLHLIKRERKELVVMHTSSPGSPFSVILDDVKSVSKNDLEEAAIFTACFSQAWKSGKKVAHVDIFKTSQLSKSEKMKTGTWGVLGGAETIAVPLELYLTRQEKALRAVPERSANQKLLKIIPGKIKKEDIIAKIQLEINKQLKQDELLSALPAGGIKIEKIKGGEVK